MSPWANKFAHATLLAAVCGCASTPQTTRLRASDFDVTVNEVAARLAGSDFLARRRPDSPQIRMVARGVENLTSDVLSLSEMWTAVARVQSAFPLRELADARNIVFQMPVHQVRALREAGFDVPLTAENRPTHELFAVFRSATRSGVSAAGGGYTDLRKDYYFLEYRIVDLATRELVWSGSFEFARQASGLAIN